MAGYLAGIERHNLRQVESYLAPSERAGAESVLQAFATQRAYISGPVASGLSQSATRATVALSVEVCSPLPGSRIFSCESVDREPLGLPRQMSCIKVDGKWYVTTLFKPS